MAYLRVSHFFCLFFVHLKHYTVIAQFNSLPVVNFYFTLTVQP